VWGSQTLLDAVYAAGYEVAHSGPYHGAIVEDALRIGFNPLTALDDVFFNVVPPGVLILGGLAWDQLDDSTADWFYMQRRALAAGGGPDAHTTIDAFKRWWFEEAFRGVMPHTQLRQELQDRFEERVFQWAPALYEFLEGEPSLVLERWVIDRGVVRALRFEYVGVRS